MNTDITTPNINELLEFILQEDPSLFKLFVSLLEVCFQR